MRSSFKLLWVAVAIISVSACGGSSPKPTPVATSTATSTPSIEKTPTSTTSPTPSIPGYPRDTRTGDPQVDAVLDAVLSGDISRVKPLLRFYSVGCVPASTGIGGPPICPPGVAAGTPFDVFPNARCPEGQLATRDGIDSLLSALSSSSSRLFAIYRQTPNPPSADPFAWPRGAFGVVLTTPTPSAYYAYSVSRLEVDTGQIVLAGLACPSDTAQDFLGRLPAQDFFLPPPPGTTPTALPTYTADPSRFCGGYGLTIRVSIAGGTVRAYQVNPARPEQTPLLLDLVWPPDYSVREAQSGPEIVSPDGSIHIRDNALIVAGGCPQSGGRLFLEDPRPGSITYPNSP